MPEMIIPGTTYKENIMPKGHGYGGGKDVQSDDCNESAVKSSQSTKTSQKKGKDTKEYKDTSSQDQ